MAKEVHRSHFSAIQWNILANVFVAVDTITLYIQHYNMNMKQINIHATKTYNSESQQQKCWS